MILTNPNRFRRLKFRHLIYLWLVFVYDFDKLKPFSVSEIQTPNLSLVVKLYDFDKLEPFSVSEIQTPNLSLVGICI
jgi:hypothetical protein